MQQDDTSFSTQRSARSSMYGFEAGRQSESPTGTFKIDRNAARNTLKETVVHSTANGDAATVVLREHANPPSPPTTLRGRAGRLPNSSSSSPQQTGDSLVSSHTMWQFRSGNMRFHWPESDSIHIKVPFRDDFPLDSCGQIVSTKKSVIYACRTNDNVHGFGDVVAVKSVIVGQGRKRAPDLAKFDTEVQNMQGLSHLHIVAFLGSFEHRNQLCIVMFPAAKAHLGTYMSEMNESWQSGDSLNTITNLRRLRSFFACLCRTLHYLHSRLQKMKHYDIKPENILVDQHGHVLLADFGTARLYEPTQTVETSDTSPGMTVNYAAPEVLERGTKTLDIDIFSLGCVFLEMASVLGGFDLKEMRNALSASGCHPPTPTYVPIPHTQASDFKYAFILPQVPSWACVLHARAEQLQTGHPRCYTPSALSRPVFMLHHEHRSVCLDESALSGIEAMLCRPGGQRPDLLGLAALFTFPDERCPCSADVPLNNNVGNEVIDDDDAMPPVLEVDTNGEMGAVLPVSGDLSDKISEKDTVMRSTDSVKIPSSTNHEPDHPTMPQIRRTARLYRPSAAPNIIDSELEETTWVLVYDRKKELKKQLSAVPRHGFDLSQDGVWMDVPRGDGFNYRALTGDLNLWKMLPLEANINRVLGRTKYIFIKGQIPEKFLLGRQSKARSNARNSRSRTIRNGQP